MSERPATLVCDVCCKTELSHVNTVRWMTEEFAEYSKERDRWGTYHIPGRRQDICPKCIERYDHAIQVLFGWR